MGPDLCPITFQVRRIWGSCATFEVDLMAEAEDMAGELRGVEADYVFFAAYMQKDDEVEATRVNGDMLAAFCKALEINGCATKIKRFILVTGAKNYGVHLGRVKIPMEETDPWLPEPPFPPNFYYRQQRILQDFARRNSVEWVVTYSSEVFGFAKGNFMNLASAIGIYAAVFKELGNELVFPGAEEFYSNVTMFTDAGLHAQFCNWAALEPKAANQVSNIVDGDAESWMDLWPKVARDFGLSVPADQFSRPAPLASEKALQAQPPLSVAAKAAGLEEEVQQAWKAMAEKHGLDASALNMASWAFVGFAWGRDYNIVQSMSRARKLEWTGYKDSWDNLKGILDRLR
ncbi:hypothetical protein CSAL01_12915 [Colletotrichum salicis]|uniref:PRISE-like Rossmann-fold domain-containing protein n=1 Tax=Colletotrichum salicis TaxID=1209931 RepID=A0A135UFG2_9PEZI|nr:hypothetical protein CSAL01_12915 [Colletotrichum salicis]